MSLPHVPGKRVECMNKHDKWEGRRGGGTEIFKKCMTSFMDSPMALLYLWSVVMGG